MGDTNEFRSSINAETSAAATVEMPDRQPLMFGSKEVDGDSDDIPPERETFKDARMKINKVQMYENPNEIRQRRATWKKEIQQKQEPK